ncbi:hypothetical protein DL89DRAFT_114750 [Linderina pennispora]|uniref:Uncharacterized protein n=1 Tax=Linderina pennispora TaxID=61395 RepID=A0A1Y1VVW0_9FUNG|nr:uncharacterized protein DL89DRAFT_114750 [Linderina pennispora]ORX65428.1 hypothetical protein DL89DRAFT_114750 [Linderina pennispora]
MSLVTTLYAVSAAATAFVFGVIIHACAKPDPHKPKNHQPPGPLPIPQNAVSGHPQYTSNAGLSGYLHVEPPANAAVVSIPTSLSWQHQNSAEKKNPLTPYSLQSNLLMPTCSIIAPPPRIYTPE